MTQLVARLAWHVYAIPHSGLIKEAFARRPDAFSPALPHHQPAEEVQETNGSQTHKHRHTPVNRCNSHVPRFPVVHCHCFLFLCVTYARLWLVPDEGRAISSLSVTCKVDALWAARETRHWNLISLSGRCLQAPSALLALSLVV